MDNAPCQVEDGLCLGLLTAEALNVSRAKVSESVDTYDNDWRQLPATS